MYKHLPLYNMRSKPSNGTLFNSDQDLVVPGKLANKFMIKGLAEMSICHCD
jgi:hypothetical protein